MADHAYVMRTSVESPTGTHLVVRRLTEESAGSVGPSLLGLPRVPGRSPELSAPIGGAGRESPGVGETVCPSRDADSRCTMSGESRAEPAGFESIEGVASVEWLGAEVADAPTLLVEVPHGADRRTHYDALRARLRGDLPDDLHLFFHANTDVGAWALGRRVAERVIAACPSRSALVFRCELPRTFVDTNRLVDAEDELAKGGLTRAIPAYVRSVEDKLLLASLHRTYVSHVERAYERVCGAGGFALNPHTYGPRTMSIARVDEGIVDALREAAEPERWEGWPLRSEIDLITATADGTRHAPDPMPERLLAAYRALGCEATENGTYSLHPAAQGYRWATAHPDRVLCLEVRRDLLVRSFQLFEEMEVDPEAVDRLAGPLADAIDARLASSGR